MSQKNRNKHAQKFTDSKENIDQRRKKVYSLHLVSYTNKEIADNLQVSLSTVEKDLHAVNGSIRDWFGDIGSKKRFKAAIDADIYFNHVLKELCILSKNGESSVIFSPFSFLDVK